MDDFRRRFGPLLRRALAAAVFSCAPGALSGAEFASGGFSFSDELGGFRLVSASGAGTQRDPIVVVEEIAEVAPITLVIRQLGRKRGAPYETFAPLYLAKVVLNRSNRIWAGFELELQEILGEPSIYTDGLSFNQFGAASPDVRSDSFGGHNRIFEPYDRIRFDGGHVNPEASARFDVVITDPTPRREFYLVQDPQLLSVQHPGPLPAFAYAGGP